MLSILNCRPGHVRGLAHFSTERINLTRHMTFCQTTDRRIAGHLTDGVGVDRQEQRLTAHPCRGQRSLNPGVTGTNNDHIILLWINKHEE